MINPSTFLEQSLKQEEGFDEDFEDFIVDRDEDEEEDRDYDPMMEVEPEEKQETLFLSLIHI